MTKNYKEFLLSTNNYSGRYNVLVPVACWIAGIKYLLANKKWLNVIGFSILLSRVQEESTPSSVQ